ncbi:MAG: UPF0182 family protein, partial [Acidobacteriota bacterium]|nr:UPF0182 family protein [Acidobacteriota bacterium]
YLSPEGAPGTAGVDFPGGIRLSSTLRTALLAWHFGSANLLFSSELTSESRLVHRRLVTDRAQAIAPFLHFPEEPYPVLTDDRIVWVLEGFTATPGFPLSDVRRIAGSGPQFNYVRNSIKVTVDAVTGDIGFYRIPIEDPLADTYAAAYPGLIRDVREMPEKLREHLRYPETLIDIQSEVLLRYHLETAAAFHAADDVWRVPVELTSGTNLVSYRPEYGIYRLPWEDRARFQRTAVFVPFGRDNLTAFLVARTGELGEPETILVDVPVDDQVLGPRLIEAQIEQDPSISQQFSLWRSGGSEVEAGHLHLVPVGNRFLYMEPIFLAAAADAIPELRRFVVSDGERIVMTETLDDAIALL